MSRESGLHSAALCWCGHDYKQHFSNDPQFGCMGCMEKDPELFANKDAGEARGE